MSQVTVIFEDGTDIYFARQLVSERLPEAKESLPPGVGEPFMGPIWTGLGEIYFWSVEAGPRPASRTARPTRRWTCATIQEWIVKPQLRTVPGVTEVNTIGGYEKQFHVTPDPMKLIAYGLSFRDVMRGPGHEQRQRGRRLHRAQRRAVPRPRRPAACTDLEDIRRHRGRDPQRRARSSCSDVAEVRLGKELRTGAGTANGHEAVLGTAIMLIGENSRTVSQRVDAKIDEVNRSLPENVKVTTVYDRTYLVDATLRDRPQEPARRRRCW